MSVRWPAPAGLHPFSARLPVEGRLPSFDGATGWLNSPPLTPTACAGKVILVNFWTYTCINWLRQLPYLRAWAGTYADHGLVVIGVHTPEFGFEHELADVRSQGTLADRLSGRDRQRLRGPRCLFQPLPAGRLLRRRAGRIRHHHFGEGEYQQSEMVIQQLLIEAGTTDHDHEFVSGEARGGRKPRPTGPH